MGLAANLMRNAVSDEESILPQEMYMAPSTVSHAESSSFSTSAMMSGDSLSGPSSSPCLTLLSASSIILLRPCSLRALFSSCSPLVSSSSSSSSAPSRSLNLE
jgi:hypothetical protein